MDEGHQDARSRSADRMAKRNRSAIDIDFVGIPAQFPVNCESLGGERLVRLDQVDIL